MCSQVYLYASGIGRTLVRPFYHALIKKRTGLSLFCMTVVFFLCCMTSAAVNARAAEQDPVSEAGKAAKQRNDEEIRSIFEGRSEKLLVIIGPCSADREDAVLEYMHRLRKVQDQVIDRIFMVPRVYTNKPRTTGTGYKGMLHQPDPHKSEDMLAGLIAIRDMHTRVVRETGFTCAEEMLYPENHYYLSDLFF